METEATPKKKLIVDCDEETWRYLTAISAAIERPNAWVVRRLVAAAAAEIFPGIDQEGGIPDADLVALKELGLLGLEAMSNDGPFQPRQ